MGFHETLYCDFWLGCVLVFSVLHGEYFGTLAAGYVAMEGVEVMCWGFGWVSVSSATNHLLSSASAAVVAPWTSPCV